MAILNLFFVYTSYSCILYCILVLGFRLLLHPLRKYPGPFAAKLSEAYGGFYALRKRLHLQTYENHLRYGPVLRQAPNRLIFNSVSALQAIYQNERVNKSYVYAVAQPEQHNTFITTNRAQHRPKRRLMSQVLSEQSMRSFEPIMVNQVLIFLRQLLQANSSPVNMTPMCRYLGLDVAGLLGFGYERNLQTDHAHRSLTDALTFGNYRTNQRLNTVLMDLLPNRLRTELRATIEKMILTRLAQPSEDKHDLLSVFSEAEQSDLDIKNMKKSAIWAEAILFFAAGGETIASTLAATFFYLSQNPECYQKLATEIRSTFSSGSEIRGGPRLSSCRYLRACIDEALRMSPPVPGTLWREAATDAKDKPLIIGVSIYSLHHNENYFPDSFQFQPERWLAKDNNNNNNNNNKAAHEAFVAFSMGSRVCAGKAMAYLETSLVLVMTFWYFDFEPSSSEGKEAGEQKNTAGGKGWRVGEFQMQDIFAAGHDGPELRFRPRGDFCCEELSRRGNGPADMLQLL
ncbi:Uu.00g082320.m01.CDS01 [Anthostomella pinea]|uniref:Uu.00g082320.m01.CDS01 n=1 Tax=Anthostomella pinea TaxID=933095 RepID=A0AAI8VMA3_9PEZI|nr:Uu.00g082320.m01.CDS01 [Anthostomella pinea]